MDVASANCFSLFRHEIFCAFSLAHDKAGKSIAARIAIIAITTSNSIKVNPRRDEARPFADVLVDTRDTYIESTPPDPQSGPAEHAVLCAPPPRAGFPTASFCWP